MDTVVTVEPGGQMVFEGYGAALVDGQYGVDLRWKDASTLDIHYHQAHRSTVFDQNEIKATIRADRPDDR